MTEVDGLRDALAIDRVGDRLADPKVVEPQAGVLVVQREDDIRRVRPFHDDQVGVGLEPIDILTTGIADRVDVAGLDLDGPVAGFEDWHEAEFVEIRRARVGDELDVCTVVSRPTWS